MTRRTLLQSAAALSAITTLPRTSRAFASSESVLQLQVQQNQTLAVIPTNFIGLGYEMSSVAQPGLLSVENASYIQLLRKLGRNGVIRLGGIVADFTSYSAAGRAIAEPKNTVITRACLQQLRGFLDQTGWTAIWSVNFGRGTLEEAILEAKDVAQVLGPRLYAIELGNEVENYSHGEKPLRQSPYNYDQYRVEYTRWRTAILAAVPGLHFAAPDTAGSVEWLERMASDAHGDVQLLTTHYYRGSQRLGTPDQLLHPDPELEIKLERLQRASKASGIPWRMCETNSFFGGGRPGVSDTLAGALWTLDYMLLLAKYGCAGVNIETGVNQLGFISSYSPIQDLIKDDRAGHNSAGPPYYGMLAFAAATANAPKIFTIDFDQSNTQFTAYALGAREHLRNVVLINKSSDESVRLPLQNLGIHRASALRLVGSSLNSKTGITFGGAAVDASGHWTPAKTEPVIAAMIAVPPGSAVVLRSVE